MERLLFKMDSLEPRSYHFKFNLISTIRLRSMANLEQWNAGEALYEFRGFYHVHIVKKQLAFLNKCQTEREYTTLMIA